jgi:hypothetical protein
MKDNRTPRQRANAVLSLTIPQQRAWLVSLFEAQDRQSKQSESIVREFDEYASVFKASDRQATPSDMEVLERSNQRMLARMAASREAEKDAP